MKITSKITLSFALLTGLVVMVGYVGLATSTQTKTHLDRVITQNTPTVMALQDLHAQGIHVVMDTTRYALLHLVPSSLAEHQQGETENLDEELQEHIKEILEPYDKALQQYTHLITSYFPDESTHADKIVATGDEIKQLSLQIIALTNNQKKTQVLEVINGKLEHAEEEFIDAIDEALEHERKEFTEQQNLVEETISQGKVTIIVFAIIGLLGTLSLGVILARTLSMPLKILEQAALEFSRGNLERKVAIDSGDEIGTLARAFNQMGNEIQARTVSRDYMENILRSMGDALIVLNAQGSISGSNRSAQELLQYSEEELLGLPIHKVLDEGEQQATISKFDNGQNINLENYFIAKDGRRIPVAISLSPLYDNHGAFNGGVLVAQDITEHKQAETHLYKLANYDALTGLPNRLLLMDRLKQAMSRTPWHDRLVAIMFCDLDRFKVINDSLGHNTGDRLLQLVTARFQTCLREGDTIARLGGDEFVVILNDLAKISDIYPIAHKLITTVSQPIELEGQQIYITVSIGISIFPNDGDNTESLLKHADIAMYRAKEEGKNNFQLYTPEMNVKAKQRFTLEGDLRRAIEQQALELYYQPQIQLSTGIITGAEALLRWQHPERGFISPLDFIPIAEETGLIIPLGEWILHSACQQAMRWQHSGLPAIRMGVNIANRQFAHDKLISTVQEALTQSGLAAAKLDLELTENIVMHNPKQALQIMEALKELGVQLSIDDFGTGYSSLSHLRRFPIDTLKIDRSFIKDITVDKDDETIAMTILAMAKQLHLRVVAEGVELAEQRDFLAKLGCDEVQGYFYSRPLPAEQFGTLLQAAMPAPPKQSSNNT